MCLELTVSDLTSICPKGTLIQLIFPVSSPHSPFPSITFSSGSDSPFLDWPIDFLWCSHNSLFVLLKRFSSRSFKEVSHE